MAVNEQRSLGGVFLKRETLADDAVDVHVDFFSLLPLLETLLSHLSHFDLGSELLQLPPKPLRHSEEFGSGVRPT